MFLLVCGCGLLRGVAAWADLPWIADQTGHPYEGFTIWDMILPLFVFMSGAAIPFGFGKRLDADGRPTRGFWTHLVKRFALLWVLGMALQNGLLTLDPLKIDPYRNVLQTIAILMVTTSLWWLVKSWKVRLAVPVLALAAVGVLQASCGDYTEAGSISWRLEHAWRTAVLPVGSIGLQPRGYNSFLVGALVCALVFGPAGCFSTELLRSARSERFKVAALLGIGIVLASVGWVLLPWIPSIKRMMTLSFTLQSLGYSFLLMGGCYAVVDVLKVRRGLGLFLLYGQFSLAAYVFHGLFQHPINEAGAHLTQGLAHWVGEASRDFWTAVGSAILVTGFLLLWEKRNKEGGK